MRLEAIYRLTYRPDSTAPVTRTDLMRLQLGSKVSRFESLNPVRDDSALSAQIGEGAAQSKATGTMPTLEIDASYVSRFRGQVIFELPAARQVMVTDKIERLPCG